MEPRHQALAFITKRTKQWPWGASKSSLQYCLATEPSLQLCPSIPPAVEPNSSPAQLLDTACNPTKLGNLDSVPTWLWSKVSSPTQPKSLSSEEAANETSQLWWNVWIYTSKKLKNPRRINSKKSTMRHIIIKLSKPKYKKSVLKAAREKRSSYKCDHQYYQWIYQQKPFRTKDSGMKHLKCWKKNNNKTVNPKFYTW